MKNFSTPILLLALLASLSCGGPASAASDPSDAYPLLSTSGAFSQTHFSVARLNQVSAVFDREIEPLRMKSGYPRKITYHGRVLQVSTYGVEVRKRYTFKDAIIEKFDGIEGGSRMLIHLSPIPVPQAKAIVENMQAVQRQAHGHSELMADLTRPARSSRWSIMYATPQDGPVESYTLYLNRQGLCYRIEYASTFTQWF